MEKKGKHSQPCVQKGKAINNRNLTGNLHDARNQGNLVNQIGIVHHMIYKYMGFWYQVVLRPVHTDDNDYHGT